MGSDARGPGVRRARIGFLSCLGSAAGVASHLLDHGIDLDRVITISPEQASRARVSGYFDFGPFCRERNVGIHRLDRYDMKCPVDEGFFARERFDLLLVCGWNRLVPGPILDQLELGGIGVHGSPEPLPVGRGRSPMNWALIEGKRRIIVHFFHLTPGVDDGDVVGTRQFEINEHDTIRTLYFKFTIAVKRGLTEIVPRVLSGRYEAVPQRGRPEFYPRRDPADGLIDWESWDVQRIYNFVRALTRPYPGAFSYCSEERVTIWGARIFDSTFCYPEARFGEIVEVFEDAWIVNARGGLLLLEDVESRRPLGKGDVLETRSGSAPVELA